MVRDVLPIIITVLFFQYLILKRPLTNPKQIIFGFALVIIGLYAFVIGLKLGLFPIGTNMAAQLIELQQMGFVYLFAFMIGFATTMAEPALLAIGQQAEQAAPAGCAVTLSVFWWPLVWRWVLPSACTASLPAIPFITTLWAAIRW